MTMRYRNVSGLVVAAAVGFLLATAALAAEPFRHLNGREIASGFTGMELTDEVHWAYVFERGGHLKSFSMGRAATGTWKVEKDELCLDRPPDEPALPEEAILQKPQKRQ
jgi:hypothetical protein